VALEQDATWKAVRRFLFILLIFALICLYALWRVENQRVERFRHALTDEILPTTNLLLKPIKFSYQIRGLQEIYYIFEKAKNNYFLTLFNEHFVPLLFQMLRI